ncbi:MAG: DUF4157 domain-containing protein, partial [Acidimicrobiales bacterium]
MAAAPQADLLALQQSAGNEAVIALLAQAQTKLDVGPAGDSFEQEADSIARQVVDRLRPAAEVGSTDSTDSTDSTEAPGSGMQRRSPIGEAGGTLDPETEGSLQAGRQGGSPLGADVRRAMEGAFGADFGGVRIHTGPAARELNDRVRASAFTLGRDIFFRDGVPDGTTRGGQELLAHELTHTIQQGASASSQPVSRKVGPVQRNGGSSKKKPPPPPPPPLAALAAPPPPPSGAAV